jgi:hypothetical protein
MEHSSFGLDSYSNFLFQPWANPDLLLLVVHRIGAKAEKRVGKQFLDEVRRVDNKPRLLYQMADAALAYPEETIQPFGSFLTKGYSIFVKARGLPSK